MFNIISTTKYASKPTNVHLSPLQSAHIPKLTLRTVCDQDAEAVPPPQAAPGQQGQAAGAAAGTRAGSGGQHGALSAPAEGGAQQGAQDPGAGGARPLPAGPGHCRGGLHHPIPAGWLHPPGGGEVNVAGCL